MDLYFLANPSLTPEKKYKYFVIVLICVIVINAVNYTIHVVIAQGDGYDNLGKYNNFVLINNIVAFFTTLLLIGSGVFVSRFIAVYFVGIVGRTISHRILFISFIMGLAFEIKALLPILMQYMISSQKIRYFLFSSWVVLVYYSVVELFPLLVVLFILKINPGDNDYLPEGLSDNKPLLEDYV